MLLIGFEVGNYRIMNRELFLENTEGVSRVLCGTGGGTLGAYSAGFFSTLCRELGPEYFDRHLSVSVSVYESFFYVSNQPDTMERTWRDHIHGAQLIDWWNLLRGVSPLKYSYLTDIFQSDVSSLDTRAVLRKEVPEVLITDLETGEPVYRKPETHDEIFQLMEATCALPFHSPVTIDRRKFVDGTFSVGFPIKRALDQGHDEILVVYNKPSGLANFGNRKNKKYISAGLVALTGNLKLARLTLDHAERFNEADNLARENFERVEIVAPRRQVLQSIMDTNKERLDATIDMGIEDCEDWLRGKGY
jgi:predicted patatin/cPLA2 family phospholipase